MSVSIKNKIEPGSWAEFRNDWNPNDYFTMRIIGIHQNDGEKMIVFKDMASKYHEFPERHCKVCEG